MLEKNIDLYLFCNQVGRQITEKECKEVDFDVNIVVHLKKMGSTVYLTKDDIVIHNNDKLFVLDKKYSEHIDSKCDIDDDVDLERFCKTNGNIITEVLDEDFTTHIIVLIEKKEFVVNNEQLIQIIDDPKTIADKTEMIKQCDVYKINRKLIQIDHETGSITI